MEVQKKQTFLLKFTQFFPIYTEKQISAAKEQFAPEKCPAGCINYRLALQVSTAPKPPLTQGSLSGAPAPAQPS
jgi:hypothetical protein